MHLQKLATINETQISGKQAKTYLGFFFFAMLWGMQDLSSLTRDWIWALSSESVECPVKGDLEYIFQGLSEISGI